MPARLLNSMQVVVQLVGLFSPERCSQDSEKLCPFSANSAEPFGPEWNWNILLHFRSSLMWELQSGSFLQTLSQYFQWQQWQELVPGWFEMVWDCLTALPFSHTRVFLFLLCFVVPFLKRRRVRFSHAFLKTGALKNMNLEPSLLLPLLHTTRWHFRNPLPA